LAGAAARARGERDGARAFRRRARGGATRRALPSAPHVAMRTRPRPVFCVVADRHRDRAVAEAACVGRFTYGGLTRDGGLELDWLGAGRTDDKEWAIEWNKFYFGLDLAHAFSETGERRFLEAWEHLVRSWIATVPVGADPSHVAGRRIQNWIYA